ncbi:hypothetical protein ACH5RR_023057 [Cinchona calisaya]|uniref:Piezo-type mechanosensitive ion channel homolog domain-containing protein n=1 Tax=Cinchona calisaya TaxID=153742 RepID=A0ABD2Z9J9_9GENT
MDFKVVLKVELSCENLKKLTIGAFSVEDWLFLEEPLALVQHRAAWFPWLMFPLVIHAASLINWSIISLADLLTSLLILLTGVEGSYCWKRAVVLWHLIMLSGAVISSHALFNITVAVEGGQWGAAHAWWAKLFGFVRDQSQSPNAVIYVLLIHIIVGLVAVTEIYWSRPSTNFLSQQSCLLNLGLSLERKGQWTIHIKFSILGYLLLPAVQLVLGISHPSWVSLPFFLCSCIGLVKWSMTSNFLGLFWCWRYLLYYAGIEIILLYVYQLPLEFSPMFLWIADLIGLYKFSPKSDWPEICSGFSVVLFYFMLSCVGHNLIEINESFSTKQIGLTEQLLPRTSSFLIHDSRSSAHSSILHSEAILWKFTINFFTYGFPVSLFALSFWSFQFTSLCSFGLLAYVGYVVYAFPSLFHLHQLNGLLLVFILLWAASTYIFNIIFTLFNKKLEKDMALWEAVGLWHYPKPGLFLLAQFCPAILLTMGNLVNSTVFSYLIDGDGQPKYRSLAAQEKEEKEVFILATIAWGFCKSSRAIVMVLLFFIALRPGFFHAVYMIFFMVYLLSHTISRKLRQSLILLCEAHFAALFILQLSVISRALQEKGSWAAEIFSQSGLLDPASSMEFLLIAGLASFCAIQNHGFDILCSFSTIVQYTPLPPFGWRFWKAGLNKSVLLSVYVLISRGSEEKNNIISECSRTEVSPCISSMWNLHCLFDCASHSLPCKT